MKKAIFAAVYLFASFGAHAQMIGPSPSISAVPLVAASDGVTDATASVQSWITGLAANGEKGYCTKGTYRLTSPILGYATSAYQIEGPCTFYIDFNGWDNGAFDFTNQSSPTDNNRSAGIMLRDVRFTYNPSLTAPPIAIKHRFSSDLFLDNVYISQYTAVRGTCLKLSNAWNMRGRNVQVWGCGGSYLDHVRNSSSVFSITAASTTLTSNQAEFVAGDVGGYITLLASAGTIGTTTETFKITAFTSSTQVTVETAAVVTHTSVQGTFGGLRATTTASSASMTQSSARLTSSDVGRSVYVIGAGASTGYSPGVFPLRAAISGVSGTTVTLDTAAGASVSGKQVIIDPAVEIYFEGSSRPNDVNFSGLHIEDGSGTPLVAHGCISCTFSRAKIHAYNHTTTLGTTDVETQAAAAFVPNNGGYFDGLVEGIYSGGEGVILISGLANTMALGPVYGAPVAPGRPYLGFYSNALLSGVTAGPVQTWMAVTNKTTGYAIKTDSTSKYDVTNNFVITPTTWPPFTVPVRGMTVSQLPTCNAAAEGYALRVSDATSTTLLSTVAGGGSTVVGVTCLSNLWKITGY